MHFTFTSIDEESAEIVRSWEYEGEYICYDTDKNRIVIDQVIRSKSFDCFVALDEGDEAVGFLAVTFDAEGIMEMENFLNPDFVGEGIGQDFISECTDFVVDHYDYDKPFINLVVEPHNKRAIKVYERAGFFVSDECDDWVEMQLEI
jgi:ribosomal-protein-alanine N-acetyltransferase